MSGITKTSPLLYKVTGQSGQAIHGGLHNYALPPHEGDDGWTKPITTPRLRKRGYHITTEPMQWAKAGMRVWEVDIRNLSDETEDDNRHKRVASSIRLTKERPDLIPDWWRSVEDFVATLGGIKYLDGHGEIDPSWKVYPTLDAAYGAALGAALDAAYGAAYDAAYAAAYAAARGAALDAARGAALDAARGAAYDAALGAALDAARGAALGAARGAALVAGVMACDGLDLYRRHIDHAWQRWRIWEAGYGVAAEVSGQFYVYKAVI